MLRRIPFLFSALLLASLLYSGKTHAQCTPDTTVGEGFTKVLMDGCINQAYEDTIFFAFSDSIELVTPWQTVVRALDSARVNFINFLPAGLSVTCTNTFCTFPTQTGQLVYGCIIVSGTPTAPSSLDSVEIDYTVYFQGQQGPQNRDLTENVRMRIGPLSFWSYTLNAQTANFISTAPTATGWAWDFGDGNSSTMQNPSHPYAATGDYLVCLTVTDSCGSSTTCDSLKICGPVDANFGFVVTPDSVIFSDSSTGSVASWFWTFGAFGPGNFSQQQNPTHIYNFPNVYEVCLYVTDVCGQEDSLCVMVNSSPTAIFEQSLNMRLGPNPVAEQLKIKGLGEPAEIRMHDLNGRLIYEKHFISTNEDLNLNVSGLKSGIYFLKIETESGTTVHRILKE